MKKTSSLIDFQFTMPSLIILSILFTPLFTYAGEFYKCIDKNGTETMSDHPLQDAACKLITTSKEMTNEERMNYVAEREAGEKTKNNKYEKRKVWRNLNECLQHADQRYREAWDRDCRLLKLYPNCDGLPIFNATRLDNNRTAERKECLDLYPQ